MQETTRKVAGRGSTSWLHRYSWLVFSLSVGPAAAAEPDAPQLLDYRQLAHTVTVETWRGGNHDVAGNQYFMEIELHGSALQSQSKSAGSDQPIKRISTPPEEFGEIAVKALSWWEPVDEAARPRVAVSGEQLRALTSRVMHEFGVTESEVTITAVVRVKERNRRWWVFGEDQVVGEVSYTPLPGEQGATDLREDLTLRFTDALGALFTWKVAYPASDGSARERL